MKSLPYQISSKILLINLTPELENPALALKKVFVIMVLLAWDVSL